MHIKRTMPMITSAKLEEAREYYTKYFGFTVSFDYPGQFLGLKSTQNPDLELAFGAPDDNCKPYGGEGFTLCFEVADVDAEHARLSQAGLPIVVPLQDNPWGDRSFISVDPSGVSVYVYSPIEPTEEFKQYFKD